MNALVVVTLLSLASSRPNEGADFSTPEKIRAHLAATEARLRAAPAPEGLGTQRAAMLERLHAYWQRGVFPENTHVSAQVPVFVDDRGVACAVAQLVIDSGHEDLAQQIRRTDNHGYLLEMNQPGLATWIASSGLTADELAAIQPSYPPDPPKGCAAREGTGLGEGPVALGYAEADVATGRRACPRTELGIGGRFGAIIDTPDFYGALNAQGVVFGSYALRDTTELFATLEAVSFTFAQNAVLTSTQITLGNMTAGATQVLIQGQHFVGGVSARILLPTSFEIPGARLLGGELGATASWRPKEWVEVHGYVGGDLSGAIGRGPALVRGGAVLTGGAQFTPFSWGGVVIDLTGRLGALSYFAPTIALRFAIGKLGIELGGTLPLAGTDRHNFIAGLRVNWRFER